MKNNIIQNLKSFIKLNVKDDQLTSISSRASTASKSNRNGADNSRPDPS